MSTIDVHEMAEDPLGCLRRVEAGETLTVVRDNLPVAQIKPPPDPFDQPLPYGEKPILTAPEEIVKNGANPRWAKLFGDLAALNVWVEVDNVWLYLDHFPEMAAGLVDVSCVLRQQFGPEAKLILTINRDPEIDDKYLSLCVTLPEYDPNARLRIAAISEDYCGRLWSARGGYIHLRESYQSKRKPDAL